MVYVGISKYLKSELKCLKLIGHKYLQLLGSRCGHWINHHHRPPPQGCRLFHPLLRDRRGLHRKHPEGALQVGRTASALQIERLDPGTNTAKLILP